MHTSHYRLHNTSVQLRTGSAEFSAFVQEMLYHHRRLDAEHPDLDVTLTDLYSGFHKPREQANTSIGPKVVWDSTVSSWPDWTRQTTPQMSVGINLSSGTRSTQVNGWYKERVDHTLRRLVDPRIRPNTLQVAFRTFLLRPFFLHEEIKHGVSPLHAAVVKNCKNTLALVGLSGVGKSTLAVHLACGHGWELVTDNYAGYSSAGMFGILEPLRLSSRSIELLGAESLRRISRPKPTAFGGRTTHELIQTTPEASLPSHVVFLTLGDGFECAPLTSRAMAGVIHRLNNYLREFHMHSYEELAHPLESSIVEARLQRTLELVKNARCFKVTLSRHGSLGSSASALQNAIELL